MSAQTELRFPAGSQPVETSEDAADALSAEELNERRLKVLRLFARDYTHGVKQGLTADEVRKTFGGTANTWAPRVTELHKLGLLTRLDGKKEGRPKRRRTTESGGTAFVYLINRRGLDYLGLDYVDVAEWP